MNHLLATTKYLIKDIQARSQDGPLSLTCPSDISKIDWKFSLNYISKAILTKTNGNVDILSYINLDPKKFSNQLIRKKAEQHLNRMEEELNLFKKTLGIKNDQWEFDDNVGGLVNRDNTKERIIFRKKNKPYYVAKELWSNKNNYASTAEIARRILAKHDFQISKEEVRRIIPDIKKSFNKAIVEKGYNFPYEIIRPSNRNVGVGVFRNK